MYPSALKREKLFACVFECIKKGFYTKCHYWLRISVHLTNGFRVSVLEAYNVDINSVTADSRFPLSADGAMPVAYVCAIFSLRRLWPASLPPCRTLPCVGRRWPRAPVSWAAAVAWWGSHGTGLWPVVGRGRGGRWGARHWLKHTGSLKERCWGEVLCVWSRDLREPVYSGRGGGGAGLLHKNACVMTGAAERRNALHNPNTVEAGPRLRWQPFLPIYFSSLSTQSPALSVVHSIPGKMKNGLCFYLWLQIYPYLPAEYLHPVWMKSKTVNYFTSVIRLFRENSESRRARPCCPSDAVQLFTLNMFLVVCKSCSLYSMSLARWGVRSGWKCLHLL